MAESADTEIAPPRFMPRAAFSSMLDCLQRTGRRCIGPQVRDGAIVYDTLHAVDELPAGVHDRQAPGEYRLRHSGDVRYFAWANGPQALKPLLFAPRESLWRAERDTQGRIRFMPAVPAA